MGFNTTGLIYMVSSVPYLSRLLMNYQVKYWEDEIKSVSEKPLKQRYIGST